MFYSEFHKEVRGQLPPINLKENQQKPNVTNIAINMVVADPSLTVNQVVDTLKKNNVLQVYKTSSKRVDTIMRNDSTNKSNSDETNTTVVSWFYY